MIPIASTTISIYANDAGPYEQPSKRLLVSGVRAVFNVPVGSEQADQRTQESGTVYADPVEFTVPEAGFIIDENSGFEWDITSVTKYESDGFLSELDHLQIGVKMITGSIANG